MAQINAARVRIHGGSFNGGGIAPPIDVETGRVSVGGSPGKLAVNGDYTQGPLASLEMELVNGEAGIDYDLLEVAGTASLAGILQLSQWNGLLPEPESVFEFIKAENVTGTFDHVVNTFPNRIGFDIAYNADSVSATARYDTFANYAAWATSVFTAEQLAEETVTQPLQDGDGDGVNNIFEYGMALQQGLVDDVPVATFEEVDGSGDLEFSFPWDNNITDATFKVQTSTDLTSWVDNENLTSEVPLGGIVLKTYTISAPQNGDPIFVRILIDLAEG